MRSRPQGPIDQSEAGSNKLKFPSDPIGQRDVHQLPRRAQTTDKQKHSVVLKVQVFSGCVYTPFTCFYFPEYISIRSL